MSSHFSNAACGVLGCAAHPMVSATSLFKHLVVRYEVWMVITAAQNTGSIIASRLADANIVTALNLSGAWIMLLVMVWLPQSLGVHGIARARLCFGLIALLMYAPLARVPGGARASSLSPSDIRSVWEEV